MSGLEFGTKAMAKHSQTDKQTDVRSVSIHIEMRKDADRGRKDFLLRLFCRNGVMISVIQNQIKGSSVKGLKHWLCRSV
jgi:uncharacterized membrane protein YgaE (UPF0421/DUF939 family)